MTAPRLASVLAAAALLAAAACGERGCIELTRPAPLLAEPHPGTNARPNRVLAMLPPGRYETRATEFGKDYQYYEVRTPRGRGYVIGGAGIKVCR